MTFDNDGNPLDTAPRFPSDPPARRAAETDNDSSASGSSNDAAQTDAEGVAAPARTPAERPSQDTSASDSTTARAVARVILYALPVAQRAAVAFAVLSYCRGLAAVAAGVAAGLGRLTALAMADSAARVLLGAATDITEVDDADPVPFAPCAALLGAWWATGPYDLAREVAGGAMSAADFAEALAVLEQVAGDADALAYALDGARRAAEKAAAKSAELEPAELEPGEDDAAPPDDAA
jgi:hypothetical protein